MLTHYFVVAFRNIWKYKFRFFFIVISISLGVFIATLTTYLVNDITSEYSQFKNFKRLGMISFIQKNDQGDIVRDTGRPSTYRDLQDILQSGITGVENGGISNSVLFHMEAEKENGQYYPYKCGYSKVNKDFFEMLSAQFINGSLADWSDNSVVLSKTFARKVYQGIDPVNKSIVFSGKHYVVAGVIDDFSSGYFKRDIYLAVDESSDYGSIILLLQSGVSVDDINIQLEKLNIYPELKSENIVPQLRMFTELSTQSTRQKLVILLIVFIGFLILIAGLFNFLILLNSSFISRSRELGLRKSVGATTSTMFWMIAIEVILIMLPAFIVSFAMSEALLIFMNGEAFANLTGGTFFINKSALYTWQLRFILIVLLFILLAVGWLNYSLHKHSTTRGNSQGARRVNKHKLRNTLMTLQIVICFVLVGSTLGLFFQNQKYIKSNTLYSSLSREECNRILTLHFDSPQTYQNQPHIVDRIKGIAEVENTLLAMYDLIPLSSMRYSTDAGDTRNFGVILADTNYFSFCNLPEPYPNSWKGNHQTLIIDNALDNLMNEDHAGRSIWWNDKTYQVGSVVPQFAFESDYEFQALHTFDVTRADVLYIKCWKGQEESVSKQVNQIIREYLPDTYPFSLRTLRERVEIESEMYFIMQKFFVVLSLLSLLITMFGVYSAITLDTQHRQKEVAIRKVNGATIQDILYLFGRFYLMITGIAFLLAFPLILIIMNFMLSNFEIKISLWNPIYWVGMLVITGGFIFITVFHRMWTIASVNPAETILKE